MSRNAFYILTYVSIIHFIFLVFKVDKKIHFYVFPTLFFLLGLSKLIWLALTSSPEFPLVAHHYQISGKRMLLGAFVLYCIERNRHNWRFSFRTATFASYLIFVLLVMIAITDTLQYLKSGDRIKINADAATSGAYILVLFSMVAIYCLRRFVPHLYRPWCLMAIGLTLITLLATETRSALMFYAAFMVFCLGHELFYGKKNHKRIFATAIVVLGVCALLYGKPYYHPAMERLDGIQQEAELYMQGRNNTSMGARISLWKSAWHSFEQHPFGQSADSRNTLATSYIQQHEAGNQEALNNVQYHMHNDLLDTLSLQGIFGAILMLAVFVALLVYPFVLFSGAGAFLLLSLPVIVFSQVDCQFYNRESPYFILLVLGFLMMLRLVAPAPDRVDRPAGSAGKTTDAV
ncbi:O-antigen ligase family protein [Acerihabitans arboris]|uniref:O-antigen ligase family protein n=1 Tax=Acerihabitans arboris TaxID=2691583 RepID=A0A845SQD5_9GAMM|nr:O-antigen ligase family protein [Acerihabitans arboris]NDL64788.1 O-antigen ligase family protein [Acerihabitans arboris]